MPSSVRWMWRAPNPRNSRAGRLPDHAGALAARTRASARRRFWRSIAARARAKHRRRILDGAAQAEPRSQRDAAGAVEGRIAEIHGHDAEAAALDQQVGGLEGMLGILRGTNPNAGGRAAPRRRRRRPGRRHRRYPPGRRLPRGPWRRPGSSAAGWCGRRRRGRRSRSGSRAAGRSRGCRNEPIPARGGIASRGAAETDSNCFLRSAAGIIFAFYSPALYFYSYYSVLVKSRYRD